MFVAIRVVTSEGVCRRVFVFLYLGIGIIINIYKNATHSTKKVISDADGKQDIAHDVLLCSKRSSRRCRFCRT